MINFRMCNNYLPIEKLRWAGIDRDHRKCNLCDKRDIGDDFLYLLSCPCTANSGRSLLPSCYLHLQFWTKKMNWNWPTQVNSSLSYWSNFQVHSATNHVWLLLFWSQIIYPFKPTILYYFYLHAYTVNLCLCHQMTFFCILLVHFCLFVFVYIHIFVSVHQPTQPSVLIFKK